MLFVAWFADVDISVSGEEMVKTKLYYLDSINIKWVVLEIDLKNFKFPNFILL